jgi:hypothetical protein
MKAGAGNAHCGGRVQHGSGPPDVATVYCGQRHCYGGHRGQGHGQEHERIVEGAAKMEQRRFRDCADQARCRTAGQKRSGGEPEKASGLFLLAFEHKTRSSEPGQPCERDRERRTERSGIEQVQEVDPPSRLPTL